MGNGPRTVRAAVGVLAVTMLALLVLAACGETAARPAASARPGSPASPPPVASTIAAMKAAVRAARSVHLSGTLSGTGGRSVDIDIGLTRDRGFAGTLTRSGAPETIIDAGGTVYVKATRALLGQLHAPAAVCTVICGKYVALTAAKGDALAGELSMPAMLSSFTGKLPAFTRAGTQTVNGRPGAARGRWLPAGGRRDRDAVPAAGRLTPRRPRAAELLALEWRARSGRAAGQPGDQPE